MSIWAVALLKLLGEMADWVDDELEPVLNANEKEALETSDTNALFAPALKASWYSFLLSALMMFATFPFTVVVLPLTDWVSPPYSSASPSSQGTLPLLVVEVLPAAPLEAVVCWSVLACVTAAAAAAGVAAGVAVVAAVAEPFLALEPAAEAAFAALAFSASQYA
jgi:hypothetical protein